MQYTFQVENIKCGGCANSIKAGIKSIDGVSEVKVDKDLGTIVVDAVEGIREKIASKLLGMGYPEDGNNSLLTKAKSFVSCAVGRIQKEEA